jgi:phenylacetate-CoA ligase
MQYDPFVRYMEILSDDTLALTTMPVLNTCMPMIKYGIGDLGGIMNYDDMMDALKAYGFSDIDECKTKLPFIWVFGRSFWSVSFFGANVYVENVMIGMEQTDVADYVTGKFVLDVLAPMNDYLVIHIELANGVTANDELEDRLKNSILEQLRRLNSEFRNYVPLENQTPKLFLYPHQDKDYFPTGVKHSYTRLK